jgi:hypothetical protein
MQQMPSKNSEMSLGKAHRKTEDYKYVGSVV